MTTFRRLPLNCTIKLQKLGKQELPVLVAEIGQLKGKPLERRQITFKTVIKCYQQTCKKLMVHVASGWHKRKS